MCLSTTHFGSPKPRGLLSSGFTHGLGTWKPRLPTTLANRLVPLRPEPATSSKRLLMRSSLPVVRRLRCRSSVLSGEHCRFAATLDQWRLPVLYPDETAENRFGASVTAHQRHVVAAEVFDDVQPFVALDPHDSIWLGSFLPEGVKQLPFPPLAPIDLDLEVRVRPVSELVCVQPLKLEARPVGRLQGVVGIRPHVLPIEALDERMIRGVPPAPRLVWRLPEVDVGDALALHIGRVATHLHGTVDTLELPGQIT